jgi:hypothetical protein
MDVLEAKGRHDPCVLPRCPPLFEGLVVPCRGRVVSCCVVPCRLGLTCPVVVLSRLFLSGLYLVLVGLLPFKEWLLSSLRMLWCFNVQEVHTYLACLVWSFLVLCYLEFPCSSSLVLSSPALSRPFSFCFVLSFCRVVSCRVLAIVLSGLIFLQTTHLTLDNCKP